jgi:type III secretory pathway component EscT
VEEVLPGLSTWALLAARIAPSGCLLSLLSRGAVPAWLGLGFALAIAAGLAPSVPPALVAGPPQALLAAGLRELCVGFAFASAALVPLFGLRLAVGFSVGERSTDRAPLSTLYVLAALAVTLALGGLRAYVKAFWQSLVELPLAAITQPSRLLEETQSIVAQALSVALALGLPLLSAIFLLDLTLSLSLRVAHSESKLESSALRRALVLGLCVLLCAPLASRMPELVRAALIEARAVALRLGK